MAAAARLFTVKGHVQGVYFRASTRRVAEALGLSGHAINLPNGDVEVLACGPVGALDELESWLHEGPRAARVTAVHTRDTERQCLHGFRTG
jgi:acylphosphatase